jgi:hypothetical protein
MSQQQSELEEAHYWATINDFEELISKYGSFMVIGDMKWLAVEQIMQVLTKEKNEPTPTNCANL